MKRIAIAELEGAALDWAVAEIVYPNDGVVQDRAYEFACDYAFSRDWSQCGPLMDRYLFRIDKPVNGDKCWAQTHDLKTIQGGPNRLVAACRAIVAAHNPGGYVELPDELIQETGA